MCVSCLFPPSHRKPHSQVSLNLATVPKRPTAWSSASTSLCCARPTPKTWYVCLFVCLSVCLSISLSVCVCVCVCVCVHTGVLYGNMNTNVYSFSNSVFQCCCSWTWLQLVNFSTVYMYQWAMPNHLITLPVLVAQRSAPRQPIFAWLISLLHL